MMFTYRYLLLMNYIAFVGASHISSGSGPPPMIGKMKPHYQYDTLM